MSRTSSHDHLPRVPQAVRPKPRMSSRQNSVDSSDNSADELSLVSGDADEWERNTRHASDSSFGPPRPSSAAGSYADGRFASATSSVGHPVRHIRSGSAGSDVGFRSGMRSRARSFSAEPSRVSTPPNTGFVTASMDDRLLEVVAIEGVLHLGLAQLVNGTAHRLCQCSSITITHEGTSRLPMQVDGEPFELEPIFAPHKPMSITVSHHNQAVMLSRSQVRSDGVALEAIDWAMQEGVITVDQRNQVSWFLYEFMICGSPAVHAFRAASQVVREIARRTGSLQRRALERNNFGGSNLSLPSLERSW